jgi:two-component system, sensor histidine kinase PdtaS
MTRLLLFFSFLTACSFTNFAQRDSVEVKKILDKAYYFEDHFQLDSELVYMHRAHDLSKKIGFKRGISATYSVMGVLYFKKGDFSKSSYYYYKGLRYDEQIGDEAGAMRNAGNLGVLYDQQGDHDKALAYYKRALKTAKRLKIAQSESIYYSNISIVLSRRGNQEKALYYQKQALEADLRVGNEPFVVADLINIGVTLNKLKRYEESNGYALQALEKSRKLGDNMLIANSLNLLAENHGDDGNYSLGERYFLECIEVGKKVQNPDLMRGYLEGISEFYEKNGRPDKALKYYKEFIVMRDSVLNTNATAETVRAETNYLNDKKNAAVKFRHDRKVYRLNARNARNLQLGVFLGIFLLLALVLLVFAKRAFNTKKRLADFLAAEDKRKEVLLQEVHHRINNNLQIISSLLELQANAAADPRLNDYLTQSQNRIQSLAVLHELMYDSDSPLMVDVREYLDKILDFHRDVLRSAQEHVTIETQIQPVQLPTKLAVPVALIMNELVTNAIKYAFAGRSEGRIDVTFQPENATFSEWTLTITDNGNGLPPDSERRKDSLGLRLVSLMAKQLKGRLESGSNGGAFFRITFRMNA